jgi:hypothetical protein
MFENFIFVFFNLLRIRATLWEFSLTNKHVTLSQVI